MDALITVKPKVVEQGKRVVASVEMVVAGQVINLSGKEAKALCRELKSKLELAYTLRQRRIGHLEQASNSKQARVIDLDQKRLF